MRSALILATLLALATPVFADQIKCVVQVPAGGVIALQPYADARCQVIGDRIDCLHFVMFASGKVGYISFMTPDRVTGQLRAGTAVWAPSPGWFHSPQMPIDETGFTQINVKDESGIPHNARIVIKGHAGPCL